jgi:hypothetical protein
LLLREIESLILSTQKTLPKSQIVFNELLPRFYDNLHNRQVYETKRLKFSVVIPACIIVLSVIISVVMVPIVNIEILSLICVILNITIVPIVICSISKIVQHELSNNYSIRLVTHQNISQIHYLDGIHLTTDSGTAQYVTNIKEIVNTILDVKRDNTDRVSDYND